MFVKLSAILFVLKISMAQDENQDWDVAVTISDEIKLFYSNGTYVRTISSFNNLKALTFDNIRHNFVVSDMVQHNDTIYSVSSEQGINVPIVKDIPDDVQGLAIDPVTDFLYWTDSVNKTINYIDLKNDSSESQIFMSFEDEEPQDIVIDSCRRYIYWTNSNTMNPTIDRAKLDGTNHEILIDSDLYRPGGIAIDYISKRLYWTDMGQGIYFRIESTDLDGKGRQVIHRGTQQTPIGLAVDGEGIYWTDVKNNALWRIQKKINDLPEIIQNFKEKPMGIIAKHLGFAGTLDCANIQLLIKEYNQSKTEKVESVMGEIEKIDYCLNGERTEEGGCLCHRGYTGEKCEISLCHNYCVYGSCSFSIVGDLQCHCFSGFTGSRCERNLCDGFCLNGGVCRNSKRNSWGASCLCSEGFGGERCEIDLELCDIFCQTRDNNSSIDEKKNFICRCDRKIYSLTGNNHTALKQSEERMYEKYSLPEDYLTDPPFIVLLSCLLVLVIVNIGLGVFICKTRKRRPPRVNRRIIVNKNITPLTYRPQPDSEQCEITIENCCNMNVCETPCFEPPQLRKVQKTAKDEKKTLLTNMENGDDLY